MPWVELRYPFLENITGLGKDAYSGSENTFEGKIALLIFDWKNNG